MGYYHGALAAILRGFQADSWRAGGERTAHSSTPRTSDGVKISIVRPLFTCYSFVLILGDSDEKKVGRVPQTTAAAGSFAMPDAFLGPVICHCIYIHTIYIYTEFSIIRIGGERAMEGASGNVS